MTRYYWTTSEDLGESFTVNDGGHYESLEITSGEEIPKGKVKGHGGIIPSSDVKHLCVSGSSEASLFAKIQGLQASTIYHIYVTNRQPDIDVTSGGLDFSILEEFRYNMEGDSQVNFSKLKSVDVPKKAVDDVELCYEMDSNIHTHLAKAVKSSLSLLIRSGTYNRNEVDDTLNDIYSEMAELYSEEMAEEMFENIDRSKVP